MSIIEVILIAISLAMDAFSVSICKGLTLNKLIKRKAIIIGLYFGIFQGIMPLIGYFLGSTFSNYIDKFDHYIAFILLLLIGLNMIKESFEKENNYDSKVDFKTMLPLSIATSIDALAVGISFSLDNVKNNEIFLYVLIIGIITFILSVIGALIGKTLGSKFRRNGTILGGIVLILIGLKILIEGLGVI